MGILFLQDSGIPSTKHSGKPETSPTLADRFPLLIISSGVSRIGTRHEYIGTYPYHEETVMRRLLSLTVLLVTIVFGVPITATAQTTGSFLSLGDTLGEGVVVVRHGEPYVGVQRRKVLPPTIDLRLFRGSQSIREQGSL